MIHLYPLIFALGINTTPTTGLRFGAVEGTWDGTFRPSMVHLYMRVEEPRGPSTFGRTFLLDDLTNVRREKRVIGFELKHEAGIFRFDGDAAEIRANGSFQFIPSASYRKAVEKLGYTKPDRHQQLTFALYDVTLDELRYLRKVMTRRIASGELVTLLKRGVTPEYVRDLAGVGFPRLAPERLLRLRERGIDANYVRQLRAAGLMLSELDDFVKARSAGLSPEYVASLTGIGLRNLSLDEYITLSQADVTAEYAASIFELGYNSCDVTDLVRMRSHGLTAAYIRKVSEVSGEAPSLAELIRMRSRGEY